MRRYSMPLVCIAVLLAAVALGSPAAAGSMACESLAGLSLPNTTISVAVSVPAGSFTAPNGQVFTNMPAFCRVAGSIAPTSDSDIQFEVWMPAANWNGKFEGIGNGGLAGSIPFGGMVPGLQRGYATASTDTGHTNAGGAGFFALGHPQKIIDFGYRGYHEMTEKGKAIVAAFYGGPAQLAYFNGCSQGGQEALMEAQRFPTDYDGIIAGDPDNNMTHHEVGGHLWITLAEFGTNPNGVIPPSKATLIGDAVNAACDALDGVTDGVLNDPRKCHFDPSVLLCPGADAPTCLTAAQVDAVKKIYAGPDQVIRPGYDPGIQPGGEALGWPGWITPFAPGQDIHSALGIPFFKYFVFDDPNWDFHTFNFQTDPDVVENKDVAGQTMASVLNSTSPDLRPFRRHGGKLIHYHGFSDPDIAPTNSINYFESVVAFPAGDHGDKRNERADTQALQRTQGFYRLFMVPGMNHCAGGPGANTFDMLTALEGWREHGQAPERILATKYVNNDPAQGVAFTRPLCPYPQIAQYTGTGSPNDAANFVCTGTGGDQDGTDHDSQHDNH